MTELLNPTAVAVLLNVPEATLSNWRWLGKGPAYARVGRHVRYRSQDVENWITAQVRGGAA